MRASDAWHRFGRGNGVNDLNELVNRVHKYADARSVFERDRIDPEIGCILLDSPVFLDDEAMRSAEELGAPVPNAVVKFKTFPAIRALNFDTRMVASTLPFELVSAEPQSRRQRAVLDRQGQQVFRMQVLEAYGGRCAITGEDCLDVLEAAHIQPYINIRSNDVRNGVALRADLHALFDAGLITVDDDHHVRVSDRLGSDYYRGMAGRPVRFPTNRNNYPAGVALDYHRRLVFRGDPVSGKTRW